MRLIRAVALCVVVATLVTACTARGSRSAVGGGEAPRVPDVDQPHLAEELREVPDGSLGRRVRKELDRLFADPSFLSLGDVGVVAAGGDPRAAWPLVDLLRFHQGGPLERDLVRALRKLVGSKLGSDWVGYTDLLLLADIPAPRGYLRWKRALFLAAGPSWEPFFSSGADLDWRNVTWGGVFRDAIPRLDSPRVVSGGSGSWLPDDDIVFGVVSDGEPRAYPRRVLEVHEIVNDELGGRRLAVTYCTLCGTAVAYAADGVPRTDGPLVFATSGLLQRSNKLMYDEQTESLFEQFTGVGVVGPLRGVQLERLPLSVTTWKEWRAVHPETTIVAADAGDDPTYEPEPLEGRDSDGPIFPVGERDERLAAQEPVVGTITPRGQPVAFPAQLARKALREGRPVTMGCVTLGFDGGSVTASWDEAGTTLSTQESFWFAWSQFHPGTLLWSPEA